MAAARRAYWKGYVKLSLVTAPVALYPASSQADKTHFHQINRKTGNRLRQQMVDEKTGKVVDKDDKSRGYEVSKGKYVEIEPDEIKAIQVESTHTIDIAKFVPADEIGYFHPTLSRDKDRLAFHTDRKRGEHALSERDTQIGIRRMIDSVIDNGDHGNCSELGAPSL